MMLALFGVFALDRMNKNEFPDITIREGVLVALYPGADAQEMTDQVMKPMEDYIFSFKEVNKTKTRSNATNGMVMTFIELDDNVYDSDEFWSKFNMGLNDLKLTLPPGVLGMKLISDFGETSAILLTMQSKDKTYHELKDYMDRLTERLRVIPSVGTMTVSGMQNEQIAVIVDPERLSKYAIDDKVISATLAAQGLKTTGGSLRSDNYTSPIYVQKPVTTVKELEDLFIMSLPTGQSVRLRDVADIKTEYPEPDSYITNNGEKCLLLSIEMKKGNNVVEMGRLVNEKLEEFENTIPEDVTLFKITNQPEVVNNSVWDFMRELLIAIIAVVIAVMILLPLRVALVAASTIPLTIFVSIGLFYAFDFELNTVTLACLIVSLGLIVDDSVVIIDNYVEQLAEGIDPKSAALRSASMFLKAIFSATLAISITFFPFLMTIKGTMHDFLLDFPWAITIILVSSFVIATLHVPFMQYVFIKPEKAAAIYNSSGKKKHTSLLNLLQGFYNKVADWCFDHPVWLSVICLASMIGGILMLMGRPMQMMPIAERNQFAVEINLPTGTALERTSE
ncbi:MAG: efflux RND transporter permease subunit, partial [Paramuribaculum sp.]|nr:efflux RND transporter permease subunit [Paramuribaculum sp.]